MTAPVFTARVPFTAPQIGAQYDPQQMRTALNGIARAIPPTVTRTVTADTIIAATDDTVLADTASGDITVTLLPANQVQFLPLTIKNVGLGVATISGTVDGVANLLLDPGASVVLQSDGAAWRALGVTTLYPFRTGEVGVTNLLYPYGDVRRYGVRAGVLTSQHALINNAITSVNAIATGYVTIPSVLGVIWVATAWRDITGQSIQLNGVSNITFIVEPGATLKALNNSVSSVGAVILVINSTNIRVTGSGTIIGEKNIHTGPVGEGVMGVWFTNTNIGCVDSLTITDCYGDCLFVGTNDHTSWNVSPWNRNIFAFNLTLRRGRRQGMSVTGVINMVGDNIIMEDCGGTAPGGGFDIEPDHGATVYPGPTNTYAPVENVTLTNLVCVGNWRGGIVTGGALNVSIDGLVLRNNSIDDLSPQGFGSSVPSGGVTQHNVRITNVTILHDEAVPPSPLPVAIRGTGGMYNAVSNVSVKGKVLNVLLMTGVGTSATRYNHYDNIHAIVDAGATEGFFITNTASDNTITNSSCRGAQINLRALNSARLTLDVTSYDATTTGAVVDGCSNSSLNLRAVGTVGGFGVQIANSAYCTGTLSADTSGQDGVRLTTVTNSRFTVDAVNSSTSVLNGFPNIQVASTSSYNRLRCFARPGTTVTRTGIVVAAGSLENDVRGSDFRYHTIPFAFSEPTTIYEQVALPSGDRGDASLTLLATYPVFEQFKTALTANRLVRVMPTGMFVGWRADILRTAAGAGTLTVTAAVPGSGAIVSNGAGCLYWPVNDQQAQKSTATPVVTVPNGAGTIEITALITSNEWVSSAPHILVSQDDGASNRGWSLYKSIGGSLIFQWSTNGTTLTNDIGSTVVPGTVSGTPIWFRLTMTQTGPDIVGVLATAAFVPGSVAFPAFVTYQTNTEVGATLAAIHATALPVEISGAANGTVQIWDGDVYRLRITVGGVTSVDFNPTTDTIAGATTWTSANTEVWTIFGPSGATTTLATIPAATKGKVGVAWSGTEVLLTDTATF